MPSKKRSYTDGLASWLTSFSFFELYYRRILIIFFAALWFVALTKEWPKLSELQLSWPLQISSPDPLLVGKFFLSAALGFLTVVFLFFTIKFVLTTEEVRFLEIPEEDINKLKALVGLCNKLGIQEILSSNIDRTSRGQKWAREIQDELSRSKTVKILGIAGYENIGLGPGKAVLYDILQNKKDDFDNIEIILLNPETSDKDVLDSKYEVITKRIIDINKENYSEEILKREIYDSTEIIKKLNNVGRKRNVALYYNNNTPVFRIMMFDSIAYIGTYKGGFHGHETPILKLEKNKEDGISLYHDFEKYFCLIKSLSDKII